MKKILVPTDFSECAKNAFDVAIELAIKSNAEIHFLHILRTPVDWKRLRPEQEKNFPETLHKIGEVRADLTELEQKAKKAGLKTQTSLVFANDGILNHLKDYDHDFIVIGSHGTKGFKEVIGSNTGKVVRFSSAPVLVIKDKLDKVNFKNIVFASTFDDSAYSSFERIIAFADIMKSKIHLLMVNLPFQFKETDEMENRMNNFIAKFPMDNYTINIYNALNEERGIQKFADSIDADVISLTTQGKTGFMKLLSPSITESLVNHSKSTILSVNLK